MTIDSNVIISIVGFVTTMAVTVLNQRASAKQLALSTTAKAAELQLQVELANKLASLKTDQQFKEQAEKADKQFQEQTEQRLVLQNQQTADIVHKITTAKDSIQVDLAKNTDVSVKAFEEANHVNEKISAIQATVLNALVAKKDEQQNSIQQTVEDTNRIVRKDEK